MTALTAYKAVTHALTRPKATLGYLVGAFASMATLAASTIFALQPLAKFPFIAAHLVPIISTATVVGAVCTAGAAIGHSIMNVFPDYTPTVEPVPPLPPVPPAAA